MNAMNNLSATMLPLLPLLLVVLLAPILGCAEHDETDETSESESDETSESETSETSESETSETEWGVPTCSADGISCVAPIGEVLVQVLADCELAAMGWEPAPGVWPVSTCAAGQAVPDGVECYQVGPVLSTCYAPASDGWNVLVSPECSRPNIATETWPESTCAAGEHVPLALLEIGCDHESCSAAHPAIQARIRLAPLCYAPEFADEPAACP
jgi:hypothetical protein